MPRAFPSSSVSVTNSTNASKLSCSAAWMSGSSASDSARADLWGRVYLETVRRKDAGRLRYANAEYRPVQAPGGEG
jgi:hypothetical protein